MTDKQIINERRQYEYKSVYPEKSIIIDGVDVSGCPHYIHKDGSCSSQDCECIKCVHNACFYKDYKNKEQECERLKEEIEKLKGTNGAIHPNSAYYKISKLRCKNNELERQHYDLCILKTKYKQTLQEIKEICSKMNCESLMQNSWCGDTDFKMGCCEKLFKKQILQKISECEVENAR